MNLVAGVRNNLVESINETKHPEISPDVNSQVWRLNWDRAPLIVLKSESSKPSVLLGPQYKWPLTVSDSQSLSTESRPIVCLGMRSDSLSCVLGRSDPTEPNVQTSP
jgi:hypothetical protein